MHSEAAFSALENLLVQMGVADVPALMDRVRTRFISANAMFCADRQIWESLGLNPNCALLLSRLMDISRYTVCTLQPERPRLLCLQDTTNYLVANFYGLQMERFYALLVTRQGMLARRILLDKGISDCAEFRLDCLLRAILSDSPAAVILCHNHPGGTLQPSPEDIRSTLDAISAMSVLGVPLLDHILVAGGQTVSLRLNGFIPENIWLSQSSSRLLRDWLKDASPL